MQSVAEINKTNTVQYSNSRFNKLNHSNSTVTVEEVFTNLSDLIPDDGYQPFYAKAYKELGYKRFIELANKARAGKNPPRLFCWMIKNNRIVK